MPLGGGIFIASAALPTDAGRRHGLLALAWQMRRPGYVASHETAALLTGLPLFSTRAAAVQQPRFTRPPDPGARSLRVPRVAVRELPDTAIAEVLHGLLAGLRHTDSARTAIDLAAELPLPQALMLTDAAARRAALSHSHTASLRGALDDSVLERAREPLRKACLSRVHQRLAVQRAISLADQRRESPAESCSFGHIIDEGLPSPECQHALGIRLGVVYPDFWWEQFGVAGECDGRSKYGHDEAATTALMAESDRQHGLVEQGIDVVRWRATDIFHRPELVMAKLRTRLLARGWDGKRLRG